MLRPTRPDFAPHGNVPCGALASGSRPGRAAQGRMIMRWHGKSALVALVAAVLALPASPAFAADATRSAQWWLSALKVGTAHGITQGRGVTVAVIDTGVFVHEDLKDRVLTGMDYTVPAGGNGQVDIDGHGTSIAGLISGRGHGAGLG